jgi:hypothetical protein
MRLGRREIVIQYSYTMLVKILIFDLLKFDAYYMLPYFLPFIYLLKGLTHKSFTIVLALMSIRIAVDKKEFRTLPPFLYIDRSSPRGVLIHVLHCMLFVDSACSICMRRSNLYAQRFATGIVQCTVVLKIGTFVRSSRRALPTRITSSKLSR